tara:strand:- start:1822 stop:2136 length:315 start_codon:yes stop_codon:yes gene_type:complete
VDVDLVVNRDQEEPVLEVVRLNQPRAGVGIRGALELERVHLVKEEILEQLREHLTEELPYLKKDKLRGQHLREQLMLLEVKHLQVEDKLQELTDNLNLQLAVIW